MQGLQVQGLRTGPKQFQLINLQTPPKDPKVPPQAPPGSRGPEKDAALSPTHIKVLTQMKVQYQSPRQLIDTQPTECDFCGGLPHKGPRESECRAFKLT